MAFIDSQPPLPTFPSVTTTLEFDTMVLMDAGHKEQRYPRLTEYLATLDLSDVTFTEDELDTFITFFQTVRGKLNTFRYTLPCDRFAQSRNISLRELDHHLAVNGDVISFGAAVPVFGDGQLQIADATTTTYQLLKVYQVTDSSNDANCGFKTITKPRNVRLWDDNNIELLNGVDFTVDETTGVITLTSAIGTLTYLDAQFEFDLEVRFDLDSIPQIIISRGTTDAPIIPKEDCDYYQFSSLTLVEVPGFKIQKTANLWDRFLSKNIITTMDYTLELDYKPTESIARKFQTKIESTMTRFENRDSYTPIGGDRLCVEYQDTLLRNSELATESSTVRNEYRVAEYIIAVFCAAHGRCRDFNVEYYFNTVSSSRAQSNMRFDSDQLTLTHLRKTDCELFRLDDLKFYEPKCDFVAIPAANTLSGETLPPITVDCVEIYLVTNNTGSPRTNLDEPWDSIFASLGAPTQVNRQDFTRAVCVAGGNFSSSAERPIVQLLMTRVYASYGSGFSTISRRLVTAILGATSDTDTLTTFSIGTDHDFQQDDDTPSDNDRGIEMVWMGNNFFAIANNHWVMRVASNATFTSELNITQWISNNGGAPILSATTWSDTIMEQLEVASYEARMFAGLDGNTYVFINPTPRNLSSNREMMGGAFQTNETLLPQSSFQYFLFRVETSGATLLETFTLADIESHYGITPGTIDPNGIGFNQWVTVKTNGTVRYNFYGTAFGQSVEVEGSYDGTVVNTLGSASAFIHYRPAYRGYGTTPLFVTATNGSNFNIHNADLTLYDDNGSGGYNWTNSGGTDFAPASSSLHIEFFQFGRYILKRNGLNVYDPLGMEICSAANVVLDSSDTQQIVGSFGGSDGLTFYGNNSAILKCGGDETGDFSMFYRTITIP